MNLTIPLTESHLTAINALVDKANAANAAAHQAALASNPDAVAPATVTVESMLIERNLQMADSYVAQHEAEIRAVLASNERIIALGKAVAAQPDKLDAVEAAVNQILS